MKRPTSLAVRAYDPSTDGVAASSRRTASGGRWLAIAKDPYGSQVAVATRATLALLDPESAAIRWSVPVSDGLAYGVQPDAPLVAFAPDGSRVAWLGGCASGPRLIFVDPESGAVTADLVLERFPTPPSAGPGGGVQAPPLPQGMRFTLAGALVIDEPFGRWTLAPDVRTLTFTGDVVRDFAPQDGGAAYTYKGDGKLTGPGGDVNVGGILHRSVAIDAGLARVAWVHFAGANAGRFVLASLPAGDVLAAVDVTSPFGQVAVLDGSTAVFVPTDVHEPVVRLVV